jgi:SH3-like domain-containing protein
VDESKQEGAMAERPTLRSACAHKASYEDPLAGSAGDELEVGPADVEWPAWRWCTATDGRKGWIPQALLEGAGSRRRLARDYDARELTVRAGERIEVLVTESGWVRCRTEDGREGWLPGGCVKPLTEV